MRALNELLHASIDYAGLFPPAQLDMTTAVENYARYLASDSAWALGRFIVPPHDSPNWQKQPNVVGPIRPALTGALRLLPAATAPGIWTTFDGLTPLTLPKVTSIPWN